MLQIRGIRVIRAPSAPSLIRVHSWLMPKNLKKFSLNPVEGISTSASMCTSNRVTADTRRHRLRKNK